ESAVWLPLVLLLLDVAATQRKRARRVMALAAAGAAMALSILAGHPQTYLYVGYTAAAWGFWRLLAASQPLASVAGIAVVAERAANPTARRLPTRALAALFGLAV